MNINFPPLRQNSFRKLCGTIVFIVLGTIQCSWTPDVETPIHTSEEGSIVLQTSNSFLQQPKHPQFLSEPLLAKIFQGISQSQEKGILQELFLSTTEPFPVFSQAQLNFLVPHIVAAFSQATPEEHILFQSAGDRDGAARLRGTVAIFPPAILFLTLQSSEHYRGNSSRIAASSRHLQNQTILLYSEEQAMLEREDAKRLKKISSKNSWIAINYADLSPSEKNMQKEESPSTTAISNNPSEESPPNINTLQKQLENLQKTVDEQSEEIYRLQQPSTP